MIRILPFKHKAFNYRSIISEILLATSHLSGFAYLNPDWFSTTTKVNIGWFIVG